MARPRLFRDFRNGMPAVFPQGKPLDPMVSEKQNTLLSAATYAGDEMARVKMAVDRLRAPTSDFDLNPEYSRPSGLGLRPAAVLIPLISTPRGIQVILTKRSSGLKHHPGQIAFPGGSVDAGDANASAAALREAWEEIGLAPKSTEILGEMPFHQTVTSFQITPVLARVKSAFEPRIEPGEVAEVFQVPLKHVMELSRYQVQSRMWQGVSRQYDTVPYGPYYIWGATARILRALAQGMQE